MQRPTERRPGFTLVEMLVVVVIITILAAILVPAIFYAQRKARNARIAAEIATMSQGFEAYKLKFNEYPPNFGDATRIAGHIKYCFPRRDSSDTSPPATLDAGEALVFWLRGYGADPQKPVSSGSASRTSYFEFDASRLDDTADTDGYPVYKAPFSQNMPYVYFASSPSYTGLTFTAPGTGGTARPYKRDDGTWVGDTSYQIVAAGQDGVFSTATTNGQFPGAVGYSPADNDNITNFTDGKTLEDRIP